MDTAGKDGAIKHVMSGLNPQGTQVRSFKVPTDEELNHDYLWRGNKYLPERGNIGIFHPEILKKDNIGINIRYAMRRQLWPQVLKMRHGT